MTDWDDGMSDDEIQRRLNEALTRIRAVADAEEHVMLEQAAADSPDQSWPPAPSTEHPWMERHAGFVRDWMTDDSHYNVMLPVQPPRHRFFAMGMDAPIEPAVNDKVRLDIHRTFDLAPYVGEPFVWMWKYAADQYGRWVAGESWAEPIPPGVRVRRPPRGATHGA